MDARRPRARLELVSGAEGRLTNAPVRDGLVFVDGGGSADVAGTWSATLEWLVLRLAPRFPDVAFLEVRYRTKSWRRLDACVEDAAAALHALKERRVSRLALGGFSMGGAVSVLAACDESVEAVIGLSPWLPERISLDSLRGKRFAVIHGALDRAIPGIPGVTPASSRRAFERACALGVRDAEYTTILGGLHGAAVRAPWGLAPLPRARRWADLVARELERFQTSG